MQTQTLQVAYSRGSIQDLPRHMLPAGACWQLTDLIPNLEGAPLAKRGGWGLYHELPGAGSVKAVAEAPFTSGTQIIAVDDRGHLFNGGTDKGAANLASSRPVFFQNLLILPGARVKKYDGSSAPSDLANAPSNCVSAATFNSRLVLASGTTLTFSDVLDPESYDPNAFVNVTYPITGIAAMRSMIVIFSKGRSFRLRGTTPPDSLSAGDFLEEPMLPEGCIDARSIVVYGDQVIWANSNGVHVSDGAAHDNLISLGGLQQFWTNLMQEYDASTWTIAGGIYNGYYVLSIMKGSRFVSGLACNLAAKTWIFLGNLPSVMFAESYAGKPELYMALNTPGAIGVGTFSGVFIPTANNPSDANGKPVEPVIEFPFFRGGTSISRWRDLFLGVDIDSSDGAYLEFAYTTFPEATSYEKLLNDNDGPITVKGAAGYTRERIPFHLAAQGFGLKVSQVGASNTSRFFDLEVIARELEGRY